MEIPSREKVTSRLNKFLDGVPVAKIQEFSWLLFYLLLLIIWLSDTLVSYPQRPYFFFPSFFSSGYSILRSNVLGLSLLHGLLAVYFYLKGRIKRVVLSLASTIVTFVGFYLLIPFFESVVYYGSPPDSLFYASLCLNLVILVTGILAAIYLRPYFKRYSWLLVAVYLMLVLPIAVSHYQSVNNQFAALDKPHLSTPVLRQLGQRKFSEMEQGLKYTSLTLPPFSDYALKIDYIPKTIDRNRPYLMWLQSPALHRGTMSSLLTAPGKECQGLEHQYITEYYDQDDEIGWENPLSNIYPQEKLVYSLNNQRQGIVEALQLKCKELSDCHLNRETIANDYDKFLEELQKELKAFKEVYDIQQEINMSKLGVNCDSDRLNYYGAELKDIQCKDLLQVSLRSVGPKALIEVPEEESNHLFVDPIEHALIVNVLNKDLDQTESKLPGSYSVYVSSPSLKLSQVRRLKQGKLVNFTFNTSQFREINRPGVYEKEAVRREAAGFSFDADKNYTVLLDFQPLTLAARCRGGGSFVGRSQVD